MSKARKHLPHYINPELLINVLRDLGSYNTMADIPFGKPFRLHKWAGKRKGQWTVDLFRLYRIHFIPAGDYKTDEHSNLILKTVTSIQIVDIGDFHGW
ncbi:MAG: hypothetical protein P9X24_05855 [Candidatus Hatepunaea meridiana]|nr:hypothetical protein [Candidatus Hatepunaea meridiana]